MTNRKNRRARHRRHKARTAANWDSWLAKELRLAERVHAYVTARRHLCSDDLRWMRAGPSGTKPRDARPVPLDLATMLASPPARRLAHRRKLGSTQ